MGAGPGKGPWTSSRKCTALRAPCLCWVKPHSGKSCGPSDWRAQGPPGPPWGTNEGGLEGLGDRSRALPMQPGRDQCQEHHPRLPWWSRG